jgi:uncharacterized protein (DUF39 family)
MYGLSIMFGTNLQIVLGEGIRHAPEEVTLMVL